MTQQSTESGSDFAQVEQIVQGYFEGLYQGDVARLRSIFHPDAYLKAPNQRRSLNEWLDAVASRPVPQQLGSDFNFRILSIEVIRDQAMVKLECPLFEFFYIDFLGLLKENGQWLIVNKMYTDVAADRCHIEQPGRLTESD